MPFQSQAQWRWAFGTGQPFAEEWARLTPGGKRKYILLRKRAARKAASGYAPPQSVRNAAQRGLDLRSEFGRGGTSVGIARARDLSNGKAVSASTIKRMVSFFARHAVDKRPDWANPDKPSNGYIAHMLWGGDAGRAWANKIARRIDRERTKADDTENGRPRKYGARAGETITGNLGRDNSGRFARVGGSLSADIQRGTKKPKKPKGGNQKPSPEMLKKTAQDALSAAGLSPDIYDDIKQLDDEPIEADAVKDNERVQALLKQGLLENVDGVITASSTGAKLIRAAESGKQGKVKLVLARQRAADKKRADQKQKRVDALDERIASLRERRDAAKNDAAKKRIDARIDALTAKRDAIAEKSSDNRPNNPSLWQRAIAQAKRKFDVYPSAYANAWAAKWYKKQGGTWSKKDLREWFDEKWVDISKPIRENGRIVSYEPCGRSDASDGAYPKCLPKAKAMRLTEAQRKRLIARKRRDGMPKDGTPVMTSSKHLPGKHDQSSHGRRGRVGAAFDGAYRTARDNGMSHEDARREAKNAALIERQIIRDEKRDLKRIRDEKRQQERERKRQEQPQKQDEQTPQTRVPIEQAANIRDYTPDEIATYIEQRFKAIQDETRQITIEYMDASTRAKAAERALKQHDATDEQFTQEIAARFGATSPEYFGVIKAQAELRRQLQREYDDASSELSKAALRAGEANSSLVNGRAHGEVMIDVLNKMRHPSNPRQVNVTIDTVLDAAIQGADGDTSGARGQLVQIVQGVHAMFPVSITGVQPRDITLSYDRARGYWAPGTRTAKVDGRGVRMRDVAIHEALHAVQWDHPVDAPINRRMGEFARGRIRGEKIKSYNDMMGGGYKKSERGYRDATDSPYTFKKYNRRDSGGWRADGFLEVLTMAFTDLGTAHSRTDKQLLRVAVEAILEQGK